MARTSDFWVGDRVVRPTLGEIRLGIERVHLEPRSMQVLLALVDQAGDVVSKKDLIDKVWGDKFVSDEVLTHAIWDLRRAFGDQASNPEFIQTIPKRGYRLIAPVKELEPAGDEKGPADSAGRSYNRMAIGFAGVALLAAASVWIGRWSSGEVVDGTEVTSPVRQAERASLSGRRPELTTLTVTLAPARQAGVEEIPAESLEQLRATLAALPSTMVLQEREACNPAPGAENEYCLTPRLEKSETGYRASVDIKETATSRVPYSASVDLAGLSQLASAGAQLAELASTYLEIIRTWDIEDPDIRPWISFRRHDVRAIRDFLHGRGLVLSHEVGARHPFEAAIGVDPGFAAPRVWRIPSLVLEEDTETLLAHRQALRAIYDEAPPFEKTMISWAEALIDRQPAVQLRHLEAAHDQYPENRPVRLMLAATTSAMGDPGDASRILEPLLEEKWCYPPLYPLAATYALEQGQVEDAVRNVTLALECEPVDPEALGLLLLLAVYEDDVEAETAYAERLEQRTPEMLPEKITLDLSDPAKLLAEQAESQGRAEISARLREFMN